MMFWEKKLYNLRFIELVGNLNLAAPQKIKEAVPANKSCDLADFD
jgi:hypothetical protein